MTKIPGSSKRWMVNQVVSAPGAAAHGKQQIWARTQPRSLAQPLGTRIEPVSSILTHSYLTVLRQVNKKQAPWTRWRRLAVGEAAVRAETRPRSKRADWTRWRRS
jgi:hypothetical protein